MVGVFNDEISQIKDRLNSLQSRIQSASLRSQREPKSIRLIAVSKTQTVERIKVAYDLGVRDFGENYVQEALEKVGAVSAHWHFIGKLQSNKVQKVVGAFEYIHSVESVRLASKINDIASQKGIVQKILIEVNVGDQQTKSGIGIQEFPSFLDQILNLKSIKCVGVMAFPPPTQDVAELRGYFLQVRKLKEWALQNRKAYFQDETFELSMGTTQDFETAIEEGATMVRIGEALFGPRQNREND